MKPHRILAALSLMYLMPGIISPIQADDATEQPKPISLPAAQPQLLAILPSGVQQGTTAEVTISGRSLIPIEAVWVSSPHISAELSPVPEGRRPSSSSVKVRLTASAEAQPGIHELRLRTASGTSNVIRFEVGLLPQIVETEPNNDDGSSEPLQTLPVIVNGALNRGEDRDCFRFSAKKGQTIVLDLSGQRLHPYIDRLRPGWLEAVLTVRDASDIAPTADENITAQKLLTEKSAASSRAASIAKSRRESAQQATAARTAAAKDVSAKTKIATAATAAAAKANDAVTAATAAFDLAAKKATEVAASETGDTDKPAADQLVAEQKQAVEAAKKTAAAAKVAAEKANTEKAAAEKQLASRTASEKSALDRSRTASADAKKASDEFVAARSRAAETSAVLKKLFNPSVRNLAVASHFAGRYDPALTFTTPHDGQYVVEVRDDLFRGRAEFTYRLTIGELPFVTHTFPAGAQLGQAAAIRLAGVNLGNAKALTKTLAAGGSSTHLEHITTDLGPSNLVLLQGGNVPELLEAEPNNESDQATAVELPATLNGVIERDGDFDCFRFTAKKGEKLVFETVSRAFNSPLDARLDLYDMRGRRLKNNDDFNRLPDSRIDHTFAADGEYIIRIGDTTSLGSPSHVYRLKVRRPNPDFTLTVNPDNPRVTAGGSIALSVMIQRHDGFKGDVTVAVTNPPAGAIVSPAVINQSQSQVTLTLTMPADATPASHPLTITGTTSVDGQEVTRTASPVERMRYINEWRYLPVADLSLTVIPRAPFTLEWTQPEITIEAGKPVKVPVTLHRTPGFDNPVRIVVAGLPSRVYAPVVTIDKDSDEAVVEIRSSTSSPVGTGNAVATGTVGSFTQNSATLAVRIEAPPKKKQ